MEYIRNQNEEISQKLTDHFIFDDKFYEIRCVKNTLK